MIAAESCPDRLAHHITPMTLNHTDFEPTNFYKEPFSNAKVDFFMFIGNNFLGQTLYIGLFQAFCIPEFPQDQR